MDVFNNVIKPALIRNQFIDTFDHPFNRSSSDWMKYLYNDLLVSRLSLVGTHNSQAKHGIAIAQCQSFSIKMQLDVGVRYFDIRCRHYQDSLPIHHGMINQQADLNDIIAVMKEFLQQYPSEFVFMKIQREYDEVLPHTRCFDEEIKLRIQQNEEIFHYDKGSVIPMVKEVRGKIIFIRDFDTTSPTPFGIDIHQLTVYDRWSVQQDKYEEKAIEICERLKKCQVSTNNSLFITYASNAFDLHDLILPEEQARVFNAQLHGFLNSSKLKKKPTGIVVMDFPSGFLIKTINQIFNNFSHHIILYNHRIRITHLITQSNLHSHIICYSSGSLQQQVTCFQWEDDNDHWIIRRMNLGFHYKDVKDLCIQYGEIIQIQHQLTGQFLRSDIIPSPLTQQQEVSCTNKERNTSDYWQIKKVPSEYYADNYVRQGDLFQLVHFNTQAYLQSNEECYPNQQQEVTSTQEKSLNNYWYAVNIE